MDPPAISGQVEAEITTANDGLVAPQENGDRHSRSWIQIFISNSKEALQCAVKETAETHGHLIHMKGILAIIKHRMNKKCSKKVETTLTNLRLNCEQQVSIMEDLLSLYSDQQRNEEHRFEKVLEYAELWSKREGGSASVYEKKRVASLSAEIHGGGENGVLTARSDEIAAAVEELKAFAMDFAIEGQNLEI